MPQSIAVAIVHGIGRQGPDFADLFIRKLQKELTTRLGFDPPGEQRICFVPVYWAPVLQKREDELTSRLQSAGNLGWNDLRGFMVNFAADAVAYQPIPHDRDAYDDIHAVFAERLQDLAAKCGPAAPLCVISHSLGSVIASNFIYDLHTHSPQKPLLGKKVLERLASFGTPLSRGETLTLFYTLGSPIALWSMRYPEFGKPIRVPSPRLVEHYPSLAGEWINFYDRADVIAYPMKELNAEYNASVSADLAVRVGNWLEFWNPLSHMEYLNDSDVLKPIADGLARVWKTVNP